MSEKNGQLRMSLLTIRLKQSYEEDAGRYVGEIKYDGHGTTNSLTLDASVSERILAFIGPVICEAAAMVARETQRNIERSIEAMHNQHAIEAGDLPNAGVSQTDPPAPDSPAMEAELRAYKP